ncbi:hypothetical protein B0H12DRAFT_1234344 [Mycena haematopus]|nr:hypothetical protein B0H12DRAFT_1234344 [Mycena haematopus]
MLKGIVLRRGKPQEKRTIFGVFYRCKKERARSVVLERALAPAQRALGARSAHARGALEARSRRAWSTPGNDLEERNALEGTHKQPSRSSVRWGGWENEGCTEPSASPSVPKPYASLSPTPAYTASPPPHRLPPRPSLSTSVSFLALRPSAA